jgi:hypothetical protein
MDAAAAAAAAAPAAVTADDDKPNDPRTIYSAVLKDMPIGKRDATGGRHLPSVIKELDPWITDDIRPRWESRCGLLLEDFGYKAPEFRYECWMELQQICVEVLKPQHGAFTDAEMCTRKIISAIMQDKRHADKEEPNAAAGDSKKQDK